MPLNTGSGVGAAGHNDADPGSDGNDLLVDSISVPSPESTNLGSPQAPRGFQHDTFGWHEGLVPSPRGRYASATMSTRQALGIVEFIARRAERLAREESILSERLDRDASDNSMLSSAGISDVAMDIFQVPRMSTPEVEGAFVESFDGPCKWLFTGG